jgi:hypothetical protein
VSRRLALAAGGLLVACAVAVAAFFVLQDEEQNGQRATPAPVRPTLEPVRDLAARVAGGDRIALRARPGGRILARVGARTEFGSLQTLSVAFRKGSWLAVRSPALANEQLGWIDTRSAELRFLRRPISLEVDLSRRKLAVHRGERVTRRISVAIGAPDTPTPPGEFYVTDKLPGADFGPYYGCCILALSGRQPNLPQGWSGGDRLAIHGSPTATWGHAVSNGCLHANEPDLRYLMKTVPLGTRVTIHT